MKIRFITTFLIGFLLVEFIYWLGGANLFCRSDNTAMVFSMAIIIGLLLSAINLLSYSYTEYE